MKAKMVYSGNLFNDILRISGTKQTDYLNAELDTDPEFDVAELGRRLAEQKTFIVHDSDADGLSSLGAFDAYVRMNNFKYEHQFVPRSQRNIGWFVTGTLRNVKDSNIVFLDCGSGLDEETLRKLEKSGNTVMVIDHHQVDDEKVAANMYMINPQLGDTHKYLSGSGVTYYALRQLYGENHEALQFATVGTVADMVPLIGLNRSLVREGLQLLNEKPNTNLYLLIKNLNIRNTPLTENDIGFYIAPAMNAASRFGKTEMAVKILIDGKEKIAKELVALNEERKELINDAIDTIQPQVYNKCVISETSDTKYSAVLGLIAGRLMHKYNKPYASILRNKDTATVSLRIPSDGFDLSPFFLENKDIFEGGTHSAAGGGTVKIANLEIIKQRFVDYCERNFTLKPDTKADIYLPEAYIGDILSQLPNLAPFGMGFRNPYLMSDIKLENIKQVSPKYAVGKFVWRDANNHYLYVDCHSYKPVEHTDFVKCVYQIVYDKNGPKVQIIETGSYE